jgi:hypothetical protein
VCTAVFENFNFENIIPINKYPLATLLSSFERDHPQSGRKYLPATHQTKD